MNKNILRIICALLYSVLYGLLYKYTNFEITIITILVMIFIELFLGDKE